MPPLRVNCYSGTHTVLVCRQRWTNLRSWPPRRGEGGRISAVPVTSVTLVAQPVRSSVWAAAAETWLVFLVFFLHAGWVPPDVNEAHYLAKAKHFWDPQWCPADPFLESADAHWVFQASVGWLTALLPLPHAAWMGRVATWFLLAAGWRALSHAVVPMRGYAVLAAALAVGLWSRCHVAGEWVVGGVEAKGVAYGLVFIGLRALVAGRWGWVWPLFGAASAFHVLVGGWSVVAAGIAWLLVGVDDRPRLRSLSGPLAAGLILALPGIVPALWLNRGADPVLVGQAYTIHVFHRLAHHLVPHEFPLVFVVRYLVLLAIWCGLSWCLRRRSAAYRRLAAYVAGAVLIAAAGLVIDVWTYANPYWASLWLRFYWFRLADAMLPVGVVLAVGVLAHSWQQPRPVAAAWLLVLLICLGTVSMADHVLRRRQDLRPGATLQERMYDQAGSRDAWAVYSDWRDVCEWIRATTASDALFLTPSGQQTFKWYAQRSEWVTWKDAPQDAAGLHTWWQRYRQLRALESLQPGDGQHTQRLLALVQGQHIAYVVALCAATHADLGLPLVYANRAFAVYALPRAGGRRSGS